MFTTIDKAIVAAIGAVLSILSIYFDWTFLSGITEASITTVIAALTPIFVWLVPNKTT